VARPRSSVKTHGAACFPGSPNSHGFRVTSRVRDRRSRHARSPSNWGGYRSVNHQAGDYRDCRDQCEAKPLGGPAGPRLRSFKRRAAFGFICLLHGGFLHSVPKLCFGIDTPSCVDRRSGDVTVMTRIGREAGGVSRQEQPESGRHGPGKFAAEPGKCSRSHCLAAGADHGVATSAQQDDLKLDLSLSLFGRLPVTWAYWVPIYPNIDNTAFRW
jgi:hypothetical protein